MSTSTLTFDRDLMASELTLSELSGHVSIVIPPEVETIFLPVVDAETAWREWCEAVLDISTESVPRERRECLATRFFNADAGTLTVVSYTVTHEGADAVACRGRKNEPPPPGIVPMGERVGRRNARNKLIL